MSYKYHELKTWPEYYQAVWDGSKTFEVRKNDRDFNVRDVLILKEFDPKTNEYTGSELWVRVTYILSEQPFCPEGFVIMAIEHTNID